VVDRYSHFRSVRTCNSVNIVTMPKFSKSSLSKLETCHQDLQTVFHYVIKTQDCTIIHGHRTPEEQFELFQKGRSEVNGIWRVTDPARVVTYKNGYNDKSKHNAYPSLAVDVMPYYGIKPHIRWDDFEGMKAFGNYVKGVIDMMIKYGTIDNNITWGGDWKSFLDYPHWQI